MTSTLFCFPGAVPSDDASENPAMAFISLMECEGMLAICKDFHLAVQARVDVLLPCI